MIKGRKPFWIPVFIFAYCASDVGLINASSKQFGLKSYSPPVAKKGIIFDAL